MPFLIVRNYRVIGAISMIRKVGAIDLGSNSLRLLVALVHGKKLQPLRGELRETRLGEKLHCGGPLYPPARKRTLTALSALLEIMVEEQVEKGVVAATSAVREAVDGALYLREIGKISPYPVRLLSGREEAYYSFKGAADRTVGASGAEALLVLDLGGRSSEFAWQERENFNYHSFSFGAVSLSETFFLPDSPQTAKEFQALQMYVRQALHLEKSLAVVAESRELVGLGGTVTTLAALAQALNSFESGCVHGYRLLKEEIDAIAQKLRCSTPAQRARLLPFAPQRADIITAGAAALSALLQSLKKNSLYVSEQGLLHGILREFC